MTMKRNKKYQTPQIKKIRIDLATILAGSPVKLPTEGPDPNPDGSEAEAKYFTFSLIPQHYSLTLFISA